MLLEYRIWACESMNPSLPRGRLSFHCFLTGSATHFHSHPVGPRNRTISCSSPPGATRRTGQSGDSTGVTTSPPPPPLPPLSPEGTAGPSVSPCLAGTAPADGPCGQPRITPEAPPSTPAEELALSPPPDMQMLQQNRPAPPRPTVPGSHLPSHAMGDQCRLLRGAAPALQPT